MFETILCAGIGLLLFVGLHRVFEAEFLPLDLFDEWRLRRMSMQQADQIWADNPHRGAVVVSLTTIPSRIGRIETTLKSLLVQKTAPAEIRLYCPEKSRREGVGYEIPQSIRNLHGVRVISCDRDWGPGTKFIPALLEFTASANDAPLVVVDDDRVYPASLLTDLLEASARIPDAALCLSGWEVPADRIDRPTTIHSNLFMLPPAPIRGTRLRKPRTVDILQGFAGYLLHARFFNMRELTDYSQAPDAAYFVDDVWVSAHCRAPKYVIPVWRGNWPARVGYLANEKTSLGRLNRGSGGLLTRNNSIMIRYFSDRWRTPEAGVE